MITLRDVALRRGTKLLFEGASANISRGAKVGLVGRNGSGKSSLFDALLGTLAPDVGDLEITGSPVIATVRQETPATDARALAYVKEGDPDLGRIERAIELTEDGHRLGELHAELEAIDGYSADARAAKLMMGLGFAPQDAQRPVDEFSGGWRMRLNLAQALMCRSDLLLLDEPTNHLDFETVVWLEGWLRQYPGTLFIISHDRDFLDNVVARVLHLEHGTLRSYAGNYSDFERIRAERLAHEAAMRSRQDREIERISRFVERFRAKATKARQAQSRLKALERMERVSVAHADSPFSFAFPTPARCPDPLLTLSDVSLRYGQSPAVVTGVHLTLTPGMRIGLLGVNGAGKSTLMRALAGVHLPFAGERIEHPGVTIGYFAQHQLEQLDPGASPLLHHRRRDPKRAEQSLRDYLGGFGFGGEMADAPVTHFSGGEKSRLVLSLLVAQAPNILLLDEPTNHLDLDMRHAIELALAEFTGALVLVSHDRHLLRTATEDLVLVADGSAAPYRGDVDDYGRSVGSSAEAATPTNKPVVASVETKPSEPIAAGSPSPSDRRAARRNAARERERRRPMTDRLKRIEALIERLGKTRTELDTALGEADIYAAENKAALDALLFERARTEQSITELEGEWLTLTDELEAMPDADI